MGATDTSGVRLEFCTDAGDFLAAAERYLAAAPVVSTVVATVAHDAVAEQADGARVDPVRGRVGPVGVLGHRPLVEMADLVIRRGPA